MGFLRSIILSGLNGRSFFAHLLSLFVKKIKNSIIFLHPPCFCFGDSKKSRNFARYLSRNAICLFEKRKWTKLFLHIPALLLIAIVGIQALKHLRVGIRYLSPEPPHSKPFSMRSINPLSAPTTSILHRRMKQSLDLEETAAVLVYLLLFFQFLRAREHFLGRTLHYDTSTTHHNGAICKHCLLGKMRN